MVEVVLSYYKVRTRDKGGVKWCNELGKQKE